MLVLYHIINYIRPTKLIDAISSYIYITCLIPKLYTSNRPIRFIVHLLVPQMSAHVSKCYSQESTYRLASLQLSHSFSYTSSNKSFQCYNLVHL